jgi:hypothetical protein
MSAGVHVISTAEYLADPCPTPSLSASIAHRLLAYSPRHAWTAHPRLNPNYEPEESEAFDIGSAAHAYLLEGRDGFVLIDAPDYRTKDAKAKRDAARTEGKVPLLLHRWDDVQEMVIWARTQLTAFRDRPIPFTQGRPEHTLIWDEDGVWCRCRLDWLHDDQRTIDDYKTTSGSANPEAFSRAVYGLGYDVQAAFYLRGLKAVLGQEGHFRFVVQETTPPWALSVVSLGPEALTLAERKVQHAINLWRSCTTADQWPAYPATTCYAELPPWEATRWAAVWEEGPVVDDGRPLEEQL